jgi:hypothetical protein
MSYEASFLIHIPIPIMTKTKIQGKFYPLQHDEWLRACRELTPAQRDVLYFVRTLDPYGDGLDISIAEIARQLSTDRRTVHRSTVSRALKELDAKGFIDMELLMVKLNIKAKGVHCCDSEGYTLPFGFSSGVRDASHRATQGASETTVLPTDNKRDHDATVLPTDNKRDHDATSVITTQQARSPRNNQSLELSPDIESESPKTIKTIKTIKTLSESERENFLNFAQKKIQELPRTPALPQKWIESNFEELYVEFQKSVPATPVDWSQHPQRNEWIEQIRQGRPRFIAQGGPTSERETRRQFAEWAETNNLVWGDES